MARGGTIPYLSRVSGIEPEPGGPEAQRLRFRRIQEQDVEALHALLVDPHVVRYLMDGEVVPRDRAEEIVAASDRLFDARGVGLYLLYAREGSGEPLGFAGFHVFPDVWNEPELVFALPERHTGRGLATEAARALVAYARQRAGFGRVLAAADAPNRASVRVLEKLGFAPAERKPGAFGETILVALAPERAP